VLLLFGQCADNRCGGHVTVFEGQGFCSKCGEELVKRILGKLGGGGAFGTIFRICWSIIFFLSKGDFDVAFRNAGGGRGGTFRTVSGVVAMLLARVASSIGVSSLSGFESDGFARGKGKWKLLEGTRAFSGLCSIVFRYGPRDRSSDGGIQAGVFGEHCLLFVLRLVA